MPAPRKVTDDAIADIRADWAARCTRRQLALKYGCSVRTIAAILADPNYRAKRESFTDEDVARLMQLVNTP